MTPRPWSEPPCNRVGDPGCGATTRSQRSLADVGCRQMTRTAVHRWLVTFAAGYDDDSGSWSGSLTSPRRRGRLSCGAARCPSAAGPGPGQPRFGSALFVTRSPSWSRDGGRVGMPGTRVTVGSANVSGGTAAVLARRHCSSCDDSRVGTAAVSARRPCRHGGHVRTVAV